MKKYVKPELFYEHYELSQHIADCAWEMTYATKEVCVAKTDMAVWGCEDTLFTEQPRCNNKEWENYCYQPGAADDFKVFIS